jgi:hypothetical protein
MTNMRQSGNTKDTHKAYIKHTFRTHFSENKNIYISVSIREAYKKNLGDVERHHRIDRDEKGSVGLHSQRDSNHTMRTDDSVKAVNVRLPKDVVNLLDFLIKKGLYSSRSEAMRDFARDYVNSTLSTYPPHSSSSTAPTQLHTNNTG